MQLVSCPRNSQRLSLLVALNENYNDGVDITSRVDSTVYFDIDGDGFKEQTAWAGASDGLLVIDLSATGVAGADGTITQAKEVSFALQTANPNDTDAEALKTLYNSNHDNKLTAADARFGEFRVWKDANQNGVSEAGKLRALVDVHALSFQQWSGFILAP